MNIETITTAKDMLADSKFFMGYSRWDETLGRYEDWNGSVERVMNMHRQKYAHVMTPELEGYIAFAEKAYKEKAVLGSQRALQFGGDQIFKHESRLYNCSASYVDRPRFFQEAMYLLLCGCGVGFSVQKQHVAKLPAIRAVSRKDSMVYTVPDSIEGWSDAFGVLLSSYFVGGGEFPEFEGKTVHFDVSQIRPRGAMISGGFKAPGPDGLVRSLEQCRKLLERETASASKTLNVETDNGIAIGITEEHQFIPMRSIVAYDFVMHMADAVLSGGIRRAACIALFGKDDEEMMMSKTGNWFEDNPQRGRSNNSVLVIRDQLTREEWATIMKRTKEFGEPGFIFADDTDALFNPCVEIGLRGYTEDMRSGFQKCNL